MAVRVQAAMRFRAAFDAVGVRRENRSAHHLMRSCAGYVAREIPDYRSMYVAVYSSTFNVLPQEFYLPLEINSYSRRLT